MRSLAESIFYRAFVRENPLVDLFLNYVSTWADKIYSNIYKRCICEHLPLPNGIHFGYYTDKDHLSWACPLYDPVCGG